MSEPTRIEHDDDGCIRLFNGAGKPLLKLAPDGMVLVAYGPHAMDAWASEMTPEQLAVIHEWSASSQPVFSQEQREAVEERTVAEAEAFLAAGGGEG